MKSFLFVLLLLTAGTAQAQNTAQVVRGMVRDEVSQTPLVGVNILLVQTGSASPLGGTTDAAGEFRLAEVPTGRQSFRVTMIGYEEQILSNILITGGKEVVLNVMLTESATALNEVVVVSNPQSDKGRTNSDLSLVSGRSFNVEDTKRYAGALGDPSRMAANFAGVVSGNDSRNDIVVRGNSPTGMLWQLEGLNIPNPNHFGSMAATGGPVSMLNNNLLTKSDFLTSAFPAQYGNALSAVFDLRMREGNNQKHEFTGQIGFNGFEGGIEGPFSKKSKASYLLNYRYSTLGVFKALGIQLGTGTAVPLYQDVNFKVAVPVAGKGKFTVFGLIGASDVNFLGNDVDTTLTDFYGTENTNTRVNYSTTILGASYEHNISPKTNLKLTMGYSETFEKFAGDSISMITREAFRSAESKYSTRKYSAVLNLRHKIDSKHSLYAGITTDLLDFNLFSRTFHEGATIDSVRVDTRGQAALLTQGYGQWRYRPAQKWLVTAGVHFQHLNLNGQAVLEPRAGLQYALGPKQSLGLGYGLNSQMQNIYTYFVRTPVVDGWELTNHDLQFTRSHHFVLSYTHRISENLMLKIEPYFQAIYRVPVERHASSFSMLNTGAAFGPSDIDSLVNSGSGRNKGIELTLERYFSNDYYFLLTTSLFDSKYKGSDNIDRNTAFNTRYVVNLLAGKEIKIARTNAISINLRTSLVGGRYYTPINVAASKIYGYAVFDERRAFTERHTPYFRTDLKLAYRWEMGRSSMEFALDLQNITASKNVFQQVYNPKKQTLANQYGQGFFPVPFFRVTF